MQHTTADAVGNSIIPAPHSFSSLLSRHPLLSKSVNIHLRFIVALLIYYSPKRLLSLSESVFHPARRCVMNEKPVPTEPTLIDCEICFKEIPDSVATDRRRRRLCRTFLRPGVLCGLEREE